ncbi:hypothetical protein CYR23_18390 [Chimaeribacter arupi]|nr:hypothetical protein CYR23_18390 [Chimaeribacter arupi]
MVLLCCLKRRPFKGGRFKRCRFKRCRFKRCRFKRCRFKRCRLNAVVEFELNRVRRHAYAVHLFFAQVDVGIDGVIGEYAATGQEFAVFAQASQRFFQ